MKCNRKSGNRDRLITPTKIFTVKTFTEVAPHSPIPQDLQHLVYDGIGYGLWSAEKGRDSTPGSVRPIEIEEF